MNDAELEQGRRLMEEFLRVPTERPTTPAPRTGPIPRELLQKSSEELFALAANVEAGYDWGFGYSPGDIWLMAVQKEAMGQ